MKNISNVLFQIGREFLYIKPILKQNQIMQYLAN